MNKNLSSYPQPLTAFKTFLTLKCCETAKANQRSTVQLDVEKPIEKPVESQFVRKYFEVLDAASTAIEERCHQPSLAIYVAMEQLLIGAANGHAFNHQQFTEVCDFFCDDLDRPMLKLQLTTSIRELFKDTQCRTVKEVVAVL